METTIQPTYGIPFRSEIDRQLAKAGPPAVFTLDARGQLQLDPARTRESWDRLETEMSQAPFESCPCLFRDRKTGWVQFVLTTSPTLCKTHPRADVLRFKGIDEALQVLQSLGTPSVVSEIGAWSAISEKEDCVPMTEGPE